MSNKNDNPKDNLSFQLLKFVLVVYFITATISFFFMLFSGLEFFFPDGADSDVHFKTSLKQEPLNIFAKKGQTVTFYIEDNSVAGLWASPTGISLNFDGSNPELATIVLAAPKYVSWDDSISYSQRSTHKVRIECSFTVPPIAQSEPQILNGRIKGEVVVPQEVGSGRSFANNYSNLNVPMRLEIPSAERYKELQGNRLVKPKRRFLVSLLFTIVGVASFVLMMTAKKFPASDLVIRLLVLAGALYVVLFIVLIRNINA